MPPNRENTLRLKTGKFDITIYVNEDAEQLLAENHAMALGQAELNRLREENAQLMATNAAYTGMTDWMHRVFRDDVVAEESGADMVVRLLKRLARIPI
jgi:hypothetical protein